MTFFRFFHAAWPMRVIAATSLLAITSASVASANPHMLVDVTTGRVIQHEDAFRKWYPASLTKLMTAYVTFRAIKSGRLSLDTPVIMSARAAAEPASKMYFKPGSKVTLDSALKLLFVKSANDIAVAIAETVGGSQAAFIDQMNAQAARLGMSSTRYINPHGLPGPGQYTTARDLAILAVTLKREFPQVSEYSALEGITTGKKNYPNYNMLIGRFEGADGMKTGFICASGFNQVSSATRNGRTVVSVVLGSDSLAGRADQSAELLQMGLTTPAQGVTLGSLAPYGEGRDVVTDISAQICNPNAAKVRSEGRDDEGRMVVHSPYILEMARPPEFSFAGIIPGSELVVKGAKPLRAGSNEIADVPVPTPRPSF